MKIIQRFFLFFVMVEIPNIQIKTIHFISGKINNEVEQKIK